MKLRTIWTIPAMSVKERFRRTIEWAALTAAGMLPKKVRYWAFIIVGNQAMPEDEPVNEARFLDLLSRAKGGPRTPSTGQNQ